MNGDYSQQDVSYNVQINYKYLLNGKKWGLNIAAGALELDKNNEVTKNYNT